ncbi:MAG: hypothetical protein ABII27_04920 [bacterium]
MYNSIMRKQLGQVIKLAFYLYFVFIQSASNCFGLTFLAPPSFRNDANPLTVSPYFEEQKIKASEKIPQLKIHIKSSNKGKDIESFLKLSRMLEGNYSEKDKFRQYLQYLKAQNALLETNLVNKFLNSKYGVRLRKALAREGIEEVVIDLIDFYLWEDYEDAFAVSSIVENSGVLYISIPDSEVNNEDAAKNWMLLLMSRIWETNWGQDVFISEGLIFEKDNVEPILIEPGISISSKVNRKAKKLPDRQLGSSQ